MPETLLMTPDPRVIEVVALQVAQGKSGGLHPRWLDNLSHNLQPLLHEWRSRLAQMSRDWAPSVNIPPSNGTAAEQHVSAHAVPQGTNGALAGKDSGREQHALGLARGASMQMQRTEGGSGTVMCATALLEPTLLGGADAWEAHPVRGTEASASGFTKVRVTAPDRRGDRRQIDKKGSHLTANTVDRLMMGKGEGRGKATASSSILMSVFAFNTRHRLWLRKR
jgi:hypothetical protein